MPTTKTMLGIGACAIAVVALCRRALRTPTPRDGRPQLTRQNAYRTLPGLRDDPPPPSLTEGPRRRRAAAGRGRLRDAGVRPRAPQSPVVHARERLREPLINCDGAQDGARRRDAGSRHEAALRKAVGDIDVQVAGIDAANALYARAGVKASFADKLKRLFNAAAAPMPASAAPINKFVAKATKGLITDLVDDGTVQDPMTTAILLNAVYFKGTWQRSS